MKQIRGDNPRLMISALLLLPYTLRCLPNANSRVPYILPCDPSWTQYNSSCYLYFQTLEGLITNTGMQAEIECQKMGAHLITILDKAESDFVVGESLEEQGETLFPIVHHL